MDMVSPMQKDLAILREENRVLRTPATSQVIQAPRRAALTTTKAPRFDGSTSWEQYHQVFEAIVRSNGWDNDTAALQLFSHLLGDALNVAHLVPLAVGRTTRVEAGDKSTALETLALKAFGDMGQTAQLRLIRDRFIAGMVIVTCTHTWTASLRRPQSEMWLTDAVFGKVTPTRQFAGRVSLLRIRRIQYMQSATQTVAMSYQGYQGGYQGGCGHRTEIRPESVSRLAPARNFNRGASGSEAGYHSWQN